MLLERNKSIIERLQSGMDDDSVHIANEIDTYTEQWEALAESFDEDKFSYGEKYMVKNPDDDCGRLMKPFNTAPHDKAFDTMTSMRNVDATVSGNVLIWE